MLQVRGYSNIADPSAPWGHNVCQTCCLGKITSQRNGLFNFMPVALELWRNLSSSRVDSLSPALASSLHSRNAQNTSPHSRHKCTASASSKAPIRCCLCYEAFPDSPNFNLFLTSVPSCSWIPLFLRGFLLSLLDSNVCILRASSGRLNIYLLFITHSCTVESDDDRDNFKTAVFILKVKRSLLR